MEKGKWSEIITENPYCRRPPCGADNHSRAWHSFPVCGDAQNGKEAIEKVIETKPDIVLLDINEWCAGCV